MNVPSLAKTLRKKYLTAVSPTHRRKSRLRVENLEERTVPAAPLLPQIVPGSEIAFAGNNFVQAFSPIVSVNPAHPFMMLQAHMEDDGSELPVIRLRYSTNSGTNWSSLDGLFPFGLPTGRNVATGDDYEKVTPPTIAWDTFNNAYIVYTATDGDNNESGRIALQKINFDDGPQPVFNKTVYEWTDTNNGSFRAENPTIGIDTNRGRFQDPDVTGPNGLQTNELARLQNNYVADTGNTRVVIAFNTVILASDRPGGTNPNVIMATVSDDGGNAFSPIMLVNDTGYSTGSPLNPNGYTQPKIVFTQGRAGDPTSGGRMVTMYNDFRGVPSIHADEIQFGPNAVPHVADRAIELRDSRDPVQTFGFPIADATTDPDDGSVIPATTDIPISLAGRLGGLTRIDDMAVSMVLRHGDTSELKIEIVSPTGVRYTLVENGIRADGTGTGNGITGADLGKVNIFAQVPDEDVTYEPTVFQENGTQSIRNGTAPRIGIFRPENDKTIAQVFGGLGFGQINGTWRLRITDFRPSGGTGQDITYLRLQLSQNFEDGLGKDTSANASGLFGNAMAKEYPFAPSYADNNGIGPSLSVAAVNQVGAYNQYGNRIYFAYARRIGLDTAEVLVKYGDYISNPEFGSPRIVWSDTPTRIGEGFNPVLTVDQVTGAVLVAYYTTEQDPNGLRVTTKLAVANSAPSYGDDTGPIDFTKPIFANPQERYFDQIRQEAFDFEPIPTHPDPMSDFEYGNNMGLAASDGKVALFYTGNRNRPIGPVHQVYTQTITIGAGPRGIAGDQGPILAAGKALNEVTGTEVTFNNTFGPDGRRQFDGFVVTFDRAMNPNTVVPANIAVKYRDGDDNPATGGIDVPVLSVTPLDKFTEPATGRVLGSRRYLVRVTPQSKVGTYSYSFNTNVTDAVSNPHFVLATGTGQRTVLNSPDQNLEIADAFSVTPGVTESTISILPGQFPGFTHVGDFRVRVNINHPDVSQLQLQLVFNAGSPAERAITLMNANDAEGNGFGGAPGSFGTFDDEAADFLIDGFKPYVASYRPATHLDAMRGMPLDGDWTLRIIDHVEGRIGELRDWKLDVLPATLTGVSQRGNALDQDNDGTSGETDQDQFAVPNPINGTPFVLPYASGSLPIVLTGPRVIDSRVPGQPKTPDNLVRNGTTGTLDIQFDRQMETSTFTISDVLRITGPLGDIPTDGITITPITALNGTPLAAGTDSAFYRLTFPNQKLSGYYRIHLGSNILDTTGNLMDGDADAAVDNVLGTAIGVPVDPRSYGGSAINVALAPQSTTTTPINIPDAFELARATVTLTINHANTRDLDARLVAPDGSSILLFTNAPAAGSAVNMTNMTLDDSASTPVQLGGGGFVNGSFNPIQPFAKFNGRGSRGNWSLVIRNKGALAGSLTKFAVNLDQPRTGTGLGEPAADNSTVGFRIFQTDGSNATARGNWTPVGPAAQTYRDEFGVLRSSTAGRVSAVVVDPTDPSGNTVYAAGASGGVWRTNNFMTHNPMGPTWVPLTDFGSAHAINIGGLDVLPDVNGNTNKTTIVAGTGNQQMNDYDPLYFRQNGVGFLLSTDAGKSWQVLDSTDNYDTTSGSFRAMSDPARDHKFVGAVVTKVYVEKKPNPVNGLAIIYAGVGRGTAQAGTEGVWRSEDGGRTWKQLHVGEVNDLVIAEGSQLPNSSGRPTIAYASVQDVGVFRTVQLNGEGKFLPINGGVGRPSITDVISGVPAVEDPEEIPFDDDPGNSDDDDDVDHITLATPTLIPNDPLANNYYKRWVYAAVERDDGTFAGLFKSKDGGDNWTLVSLIFPDGQLREGNNSPDLFNADVVNGHGKHSMRLVVDPLNPNIVYLGADRMIKVDTTFTVDPYNIAQFHHSMLENNADDMYRQASFNTMERANPLILLIGLLEENPTITTKLDPQTQESLTPTDNQLVGRLPQDPRLEWNFINSVRVPYNPFRADTALLTFNIGTFLNTGDNTRWGSPSVRRDLESPSIEYREEGFVDGDPIDDYDNVSYFASMIDPLTGKSRIIYGHDEGITTFVPEEDGTLNKVMGFNQPGVGLVRSNADDPNTGLEEDSEERDLQIVGERNGNLQVARFYAGSTQPSLLAASIAQAQYFGASETYADPARSDADTIQTGQTIWRGSDRFGPATWVGLDKTGSGAVYILRQINRLPTSNELRGDFFQVMQSGGLPQGRTVGLFQTTADGLGIGQWSNQTRVAAANPIDKNGLILASDEGRVFRTLDMALTWAPIGDRATFGGGTTISTMAFGAPLPTTTALSDFIYVGTDQGKVWVTTGGGGQSANWTDISAGLKGGEVTKIVASPIRGSREAYATTADGVFRIRDWSATGAQWEEITANIFRIQHAAFGDSNQVSPLAINSPGQPALLSMAVDWRPLFAPNGGQAVVYVGGDGGVFRMSVDSTGAISWVRFPSAIEGSSSPGGGLPVVKVTDLDLVLGNIDPSNGQPIPAGSPDLLVASTLGRGTWQISIGKPPGVSGPKIVSMSPNAPQTQPIEKLTVRFDGYVDPTTFTLADIVITDPNGQRVNPLLLRDIVNPAPGEANLHNVWEIVFFDAATNTGSKLTSDGTYRITIGPRIADGGGTLMDQDSDGRNGEATDDQFQTSFVLGQTDFADFIRDAYETLLGRQPTVGEFLKASTVSLDNSRTSALSFVLREILGTTQGNFARKRLINRLVDNAGAAGEIGNLLPGYTLAADDLTELVTDLVNGKKSPESIIIDLIAGTDPTKAYTNKYFQDAGGDPVGFLTKVYADLFKGTGIQFTDLPAATQSGQAGQAATAAGRLTLVRNLVNGALVTYFEGGNPNRKKTITFRNHLIGLLYQDILGRAPTATDLSSGRALLGTPLAANQLQGSERLVQKLLASREYFNKTPAQDETPDLPDDGLHTARAWVDGVFRERFGAASTATDRDVFSQKVLDRFKATRQTYLRNLVATTEYRRNKITEIYQLVHGQSVVISDGEYTQWLNALATGTTLAGLLANRLGSIKFYQQAPGLVGAGAPSPSVWARGVYKVLFNEDYGSNDAEIIALVAKAGQVGRTTAAAGLIASDKYRTLIVNAAYDRVHGRTPNAGELSAALLFLKTNRWEFLDVNLMISREFWEISN